MNNIGVICARLQPLHKGHILLINEALMQCNKLILCICSPLDGRTPLNPFTWAERYVMVNSIYRFEPRLDTLFITDINDPERWAEHVYSKVIEKCGKQENPLTIFGGGVEELSLYTPHTELFKTVLVDRQKTKYLSGSAIRERCLSGDSSWKEYVPSDNHELVEAVLYQVST